MNDLQQLHNQANDAFARRLLDALPAMRFKFGDLSQAIQSDAGGAPVCPDAPQGGIEREIAEETNLETTELNLIGVYDFQRMNQIIIAYHAVCHGEVKLSPELVDYKLFAFDEVKCWPAGTGYALADWLRSRGHEPEFVEFPKRR